MSLIQSSLKNIIINTRVTNFVHHVVHHLMKKKEKNVEKFVNSELPKMCKKCQNERNVKIKNKSFINYFESKLLTSFEKAELIEEKLNSWGLYKNTDQNSYNYLSKLLYNRLNEIEEIGIIKTTLRT